MEATSAACAAESACTAGSGATEGETDTTGARTGDADAGALGAAAGEEKKLVIEGVDSSAASALLYWQCAACKPKFRQTLHLHLTTAPSGSKRFCFMSRVDNCKF